MSTVARDLATTSALDDNGATVSIGSFWTDRQAVVVLIRYFDSASCRKVVAAMRDAEPEIEKRGAGLIVIGSTPPESMKESMKEFREAVGFHGSLVVDPSLDAFRAAGMVAGAGPKPAAKATAPVAKAAVPVGVPSGFFGKMKAALNADVGRLMSMGLTGALTADLVKLGSQPDMEAEPSSGAAPAAASTATVTASSSHDMGVFVLGPGPVATYEWRAGKAGELPKLTELLAALPKK
jgi:peroxiredoxin